MDYLDRADPALVTAVHDRLLPGIQLGKRLGEPGTFATVFLAIDHAGSTSSWPLSGQPRPKGATFACKFIDYHLEPTGKLRSEAQAEAARLNAEREVAFFEHSGLNGRTRGLIQCHAAYLGEHLALLLLEYCPLGDLGAVGDYTRDQARLWLYDIFRCTRSIHAAGYIARDIKRDNVLLTKERRAVMADFGTAIKAAESEEARAGTRHCWAPEIWTSKVFTEQSDCFALAVCVFEVLTGEFPPWDAISATDQRAYRATPLTIERAIERLHQKTQDDGERQTLLRTIHADMEIDACELVESMLNPDPGARWSVEQGLSSSYFKKPRRRRNTEYVAVSQRRRSDCESEEDDDLSMSSKFANVRAAFTKRGSFSAKRDYGTGSLTRRRPSPSPPPPLRPRARTRQSVGGSIGPFAMQPSMTWSTPPGIQSTPQLYRDDPRYNTRRQPPTNRTSPPSHVPIPRQLQGQMSQAGSAQVAYGRQHRPSAAITPISQPRRQSQYPFRQSPRYAPQAVGSPAEQHAALMAARFARLDLTRRG